MPDVETFRLGKWYTITMIEGGEEVSFTSQVTKIEMPLITLSNPHSQGNVIVNTSSSLFVSAKLTNF